MDKIEFFKIFKELCIYYNNKTYENKKLTGLYYNKVQNKTIEELKNYIVKLISNNIYMPKVAEFGSITKNKREANFEQREYTEEFINSFYD